MSNKIEDALPSPEEFFISTPIYEVFSLEDENAKLYWNTEYFEGTIDIYCPECGMHSIFERVNIDKHFNLRGSAYDHLLQVELTCTRNRDHSIYYLFKVWNKTLQKIGQYPSIADLNIQDVKKYSKVLESEKFKELVKAIGLCAHGIGVGSFVYLRRIFESLINEAHNNSVNDDDWNEEEFKQGGMSEKIKLLESSLPVFLVENRRLYGILSKGIHELSENECLKAFPIVKVGIEIILDEKLEERKRTIKLEDARKAIAGFDNVTNTQDKNNEKDEDSVIN